MRMITNKNGFTIIEVVSVITMSIILLTILLVVYISYNELFSVESNTAEIHTDNFLAMNAITTEIKLSKKVLSSHTINSTLYLTSTSTLVLEYPVFDTNDTIVTGVSDYGVLYVNPSDATELLFSYVPDTSSQRLTQTDKVIADNIENLIFRYNTPDPQNATLITTFLKTSASTTADTVTTVTQTNATKIRNF